MRKYFKQAGKWREPIEKNEIKGLVRITGLEREQRNGLTQELEIMAPLKTISPIKMWSKKGLCFTETR